MANLTAVEGATGDAASLISRMEGTATLSALGQVPFSNFSDRFWWLPGTTFNASLRDFGLRHPTVLPADSESHERYWIDRATMSVSTRCFAAAGANSTSARLPTGVVCDPDDLGALFDGPCVYHRWDGSSQFYFASKLGKDDPETHDYSVACPVQPRAWFLASKLGARPDLAGRGTWPPSTPLTVVCPALNKQMDDRSEPGFTSDDLKDVSDKATCGLSASATDGAFRSGNSCTEEQNASILFCHHALSFSLDIYAKRTCSAETVYKGEPVTPSVDLCLRDPAANSIPGAHRLAYPIFDLASPDTTLPLSPSLRAQAPAPVPKLFRLPAVNVSALPSIASPFTGQPYCGSERRTVFGVPRQCGPGATKFIVDTVGAGDAADVTTFPMLDAVNNTATRAVLSLAPGSDNVTCAPVWVRADGSRADPAEVVTQGVVFVVAAGPVLAADVGLSFPGTAVDTYAGAGPPSSTLSLGGALPPGSTGVVPRYVRCLVTGHALGSASGLPVYASAAAFVLPPAPHAPSTAVRGTRLVDADGARMVDCGGGGGGVVDANRDAANCGACGAACPAGSACRLGQCLCSRAVTTTLAGVTLPAAANLSVALVGGGGGAAGAPAPDNDTTGGGGGGGGSTALAVNGAAAAVAPGGAGGATRFDVAGRTGAAGAVVTAVVAVPAGATLDVVVGGGGGGGAAAGGRGTQFGAGVQAGGGGGGAGWFGGGGGGGSEQRSFADRPPAGGGGATAGGAGGNPSSGNVVAGQAGAARAGGAGGLGDSPDRYSVLPPSARAAGGSATAGGAGVDGFVVPPLVFVGGAAGGGALGGGGGAGTSGANATSTAGLAGGAPGAAGGGGAFAGAGADGWDALTTAAGRGGAPSPEGGAGGGSAGFAVLTYLPIGGACPV